MFQNSISFLTQIDSLLLVNERRQAFVLLGLMTIGMVLETLGVSLVVPTISILTQINIAERYPVLLPILHLIGDPRQDQLLIYGIVALVCVYCIKSLFIGFLIWVQARFAFSLQASVSRRLFLTYLQQPYSFYLQKNSAQLIRNVINEVNLLTFSCVLPLMSMLTEMLVIFGLCCLLVVFEPVGAIAVLTIIVAFAGGFYFIAREKITSWGQERQYHEGQRIQHLQQGLSGIKQVKVLGRELDFLRLYQRHNIKTAQVGQLQATLQQLPRLGLELMAVCGLSIIIFIFLAQGRPMESVLPAIGLFAAAAFRLLPSITRVISAAQSLRYGLPVIHTLYQELMLKKIEFIDGNNISFRFNNTLELININYSYPGTSVPVIKDLSLIVHRGESIGFIGISGSGKSTLADLILGLLPLDKGEIRVDGSNINHNLRSWQDQIGYVPQSIYLIDDTLVNNIVFGLPAEQIDLTKVKRSVRMAQLEDFVNSLSDGLNTIVGEQGIRLSGGQRQRIAIARALYHDPGILILDEATSALDSATEFDVMQAVNALRGEKTLIIIAHRLSTVEYCDKIYRIEDGSLIPVRDNHFSSSQEKISII